MAITSKLCRQLEKRARGLLDLPNAYSNKHFSFILMKRRVVSIGWNLTFHTHPMAKKYGHRFSSIHSELKAIQNFPYPPAMLSKCKIVNIRIMKDGSLGIAKPCRFCTRMIKELNIKETWFTNREGVFENGT